MKGTYELTLTRLCSWSSSGDQASTPSPASGISDESPDSAKDSEDGSAPSPKTSISAFATSPASIISRDSTSLASWSTCPSSVEGPDSPDECDSPTANEACSSRSVAGVGYVDFWELMGSVDADFCAESSALMTETIQLPRCPRM